MAFKLNRANPLKDNLCHHEEKKGKIEISTYITVIMVIYIKIK